MTDGVDIDLYADVESEFQHDDFATENNDLYDDVLTAGSKVKKISLLRIRDPLLFWPLGPGSGMNILDNFFKDLGNSF